MFLYRKVLGENFLYENKRSALDRTAAENLASKILFSIGKFFKLPYRMKCFVRMSIRTIRRKTPAMWVVKIAFSLHENRVVKKMKKVLAFFENIVYTIKVLTREHIKIISDG